MASMNKTIKGPWDSQTTSTTQPLLSNTLNPSIDTPQDRLSHLASESNSVQQQVPGNTDEDFGRVNTHIPVWVGVVLRILIVLLRPAWGLAIAGRVEVSTPVTSFKRLNECIYLYTHGIPPYDGGVCHQAPILIVLFQYIPTLVTPFIFILVDFVIARLFVRIAEHKKTLQLAEPILNPSADQIGRGVDVGSLYMLNPYAIITCIAQSTQLFSTLVVVAAIHFAIRGKLGLTVFLLATGAYLSVYPAVFFPLCMLLLATSIKTSVSRVAFRGLVLFFISLGVLLYASFLMLNDWKFLESTYGTIVFVTDLTPNLGLFWYFFIEVFDQFRTFFLAVFHITAIIFIMPVTLRLRKHPLFVAFMLAGFSALFKSYPSIADSSLFISLSALYPEVFKYARNTFFAVNALLYASVLGPLFFNLWIYSGAGNANFFYAITLVFALAQVMYLVDFSFAMLRREWEKMNPGWRRMRLEIAQI
ncbi:hypothetical protein BATDEDRAFT_16197 [Batrachochytrium dendrobatidis JAM81]|uniref:Phosphatidylinositol glycan, class U n=1 Tax=Batrachochytrium dendrobatidis (strain JAM81 / FGSC 10211) TaxID=684364 RepID=F4P0D3_BATDJ|nr:GPI-anchor transamidase subunit GAB1 [Batrachochytrium dendrobatidis JAM81]EGF81123.1 hypothetical protein BATDEDRAFT_16197 [Batrachochytrium dendrobatidis JAM81]|eukprot:XP_006677772.1 hypothetical protein BATDEDRAFT_16197 [Batrachochytrium dendrobatidis JAM81]